MWPYGSGTAEIGKYIKISFCRPYPNASAGIGPASVGSGQFPAVPCALEGVPAHHDTPTNVARGGGCWIGDSVAIRQLMKSSMFLPKPRKKGVATASDLQS